MDARLIDPRALVIAHVAGRLAAARVAAGQGHSDADTVWAVKTAHEILYESEQAVAPITRAA